MGNTENADATAAVENAAVETEEEDFCYCPKPGCLFEGGPTAVVVEHLTDAHAHPIYDVVTYGQPWNFTLQLSWPWDVVFGVGEDERCAFFVLLQEQEAAPGGSGASNVSVSLKVCVREEEDADYVGPQPLYRCKMTLEDKITAQPAFRERVHLDVPQDMILSGGETLAVSIRIDQFLPAPRPKRARRLPARLASGDWVY
ncbi:hypothetical protein BRADI_2g01654v3 [Brachypodium distachyon]|uniref:SIAH-type domain-containing protein n=1 Tax=Brachypodium distachyon TaxID=15368 RepID=A0A2K2D6F6_BRADI|nr:hypothetical protein BRADI_2g01654v3 [Brachypodium distachyon]